VTGWVVRWVRIDVMFGRVGQEDRRGGGRFWKILDDLSSDGVVEEIDVEEIGGGK